MKRLITAAIASIFLLGLTPARASTEPAAQVKAAKGPIQITLRLYKTTVNIHKSLWYKLELKNIGKNKIRLEDKTFKDPWAMLQNCDQRHGIYLEIINPKGIPMKVRWGGDRPHDDWEPKRGDTQWFTPEEKKEVMARQSEWKKSGMTEQQQSIALDGWIHELAEKKHVAELTDPAKQLWLSAGASTTTFAWAYRDTDEDANHAKEEAQVEDYTQLWSYYFLHPGKYRIRAVYDHAHPGSKKELTKEYGYPPEPWWIEFKTPFVELEVLP